MAGRGLRHGRLGPGGRGVLPVRCATPSGTAYTLDALGDLDGGGPTSDFGYIHPDPKRRLGSGPSISNCAITGVYNAATNAQDLLDTVGQCEQLDGQDEF